MADPVLIFTAANDYAPFYAAPVAPAAFPTLVPTLTTPTTGVVTVGNGMGKFNRFTWAKILFLGTGANDDTYAAKLVGWSQVAGTNPIWIPTTLASIVATLGTTVGVAGSPVLNTARFAKTVTVASSLIVPVYDIIPSDGGITTLRLDLSGFQLLQLVPGTATGATGINALWSGY